MPLPCPVAAAGDLVGPLGLFEAPRAAPVSICDRGPLPAYHQQFVRSYSARQRVALLLADTCWVWSLTMYALRLDGKAALHWRAVDTRAGSRRGARRDPVVG